MKEQTKTLTEKIRAAGTVAVIAHHNPDGDAVGSAMALAELIFDNFDIIPTVFYDGRIPSNLHWLVDIRRDWVRNSADFVSTIMAVDYAPDLAILVDTDGGNTGAESMAIFHRVRDSVKIDHHPCSVDVANLNIHRICNAAAQIILEIAIDAKWKISPAAATALYAAISGDTGRFKWADSADVFRDAAKCAEMGADPREVYDRSSIMPRDKVIANAQLVVDAEFYFDGRLAISCAPNELWQKLDGKGTKAMDMLRNINGVEYVALLKEQYHGTIHVSLRSRHAPVHEIAIKFGGGGHVNSASFRFDGTMDAAKSATIAAFGGIM